MGAGPCAAWSGATGAAPWRGQVDIIAIIDYAGIMAARQDTSITIRKLPPGVKQRLRVRAARHGRSMEAEARAMLVATLATTEAPAPDLFERIHARFAPLGGVVLNLPPREPPRPVPRFEADE